MNVDDHGQKSRVDNHYILPNFDFDIDHWHCHPYSCFPLSNLLIVICKNWNHNQDVGILNLGMNHMDNQGLDKNCPGMKSHWLDMNHLNVKNHELVSDNH